MRNTSRTQEMTVGITLMLALVILAALILLLGKDSALFRPRYTYTTTVANSIGLKGGSPVVMAGVQIGTLNTVSLNQDPQTQGITLSLSVDRAYAERVRGGSIASVGYITFLSGEKFVAISSGDPDKPALPDGSRIPPDTSETLLEKGQNVAENLGAVASQLREVLDTINSGGGLIGRLVKADDPYFGKEAIDRIGGTFEKTERILARVEEGQSTVGTLLLNRDYARETLGSVKSAAGRLDRVLEMIEKNQGALGDLLREDGKGKEVVADLKEASTSLKSVASKLESRTGLLGRLLNDTEYSEAVAADFRTITKSLSSILTKVDKGEGTAGALINNPAVYQGLEDIVSGIQKSSLAKRAVRHYGAKGAKDRVGSSGEPPPK